MESASPFCGDEQRGIWGEPSLHLAMSARPQKAGPLRLLERYDELSSRHSGD
jgi:hypothetical protein